uniref:BAG domain-containing protein n=2 Tax=Lepeophtheirus salmonis TaxID=72036 RepID=A0A0K2UPK7_LEPSM
MADHYQAHPSHGRMSKDPFEQKIRDPLNHNQMRDPFDFPQFFNNGRNIQDPHMFRSPRRSFPSPHHGFDEGFNRGFNVEDSPSSMFPRHEPGHHVESIPIKVIHEKSPSQNVTRPSTSENSPHPFQQKQQPPHHHHHPFTGGRKTTEIPLPSSHLESSSSGSPRLERAHSEPPKSFHQRMSTLHPPQSIPERQDEDPNPITTSASAPSVPGETTTLPEQVSNEPTKFSSPSTTSSPPTPSSQNANPQIRHIPIVVEGRDVPVFNRKLSEKTNTRPKVQEPSQAPKSQTVHPVEPTTPLGPPPGPIPMGCSADYMKKPIEPSSPLPLPEGPIPLPCSPNLMQEKQKKENLCEKKIDDVDNSLSNEKGTPQETNNVAEEKAQDEPKDPALEKVKSIQGNLAEITRRIEEFKGSKRDKEYLYLDEMLTRHLLSLDGIDSGGKEEIRKIRKESIKSVNLCLSLLDSKADR